MTTPNVKQVLDSLREHRERLIIRGDYGHGWTDVSDATNLEQAALLIERLANDLQDSQCAEQMSADAEKALRAKVEGLERDARRYRWLRRYRAIDVHKPLPSIPWAVRCEADHGAPTMTMCHGLVLDTAIDSAIDSAMGDANG